MTDYLFELTEHSENEGERIFCEAMTLGEAWDILLEYFSEEELEYIDEYSPEEAEILGYDTY